MRVRRIVFELAVLTTICAVAFPASAYAWANGTGGANGFGTHDWIAYNANRMARTQGATWLDVSYALPKTDDPDTIFHDDWNHQYDRWHGEHWGNAQKFVSWYYGRAVRYLRNGDKRNASRMLALLSHYYADICQPMHTQRGESHSMHSSYEHSVDVRTHSPNQNIKWLRYDGYQHVNNAANFTVIAATKAHKSYSPLLKALNHGGFNSQVTKITSNQLNYAVNGLADIIVSIQEDAALRAKSPDVAADAGVTTDGLNYYVTSTSRVEKYSSTWHSVVTTAEAASGLEGFGSPTLGAPCFYAGNLFVPANSAEATGSKILILNSWTLERIASIPASATHDITSVAVMPSDGAHGIIYVASATRSDCLFKYDLSTHAYLGTLALRGAPVGVIRGLARRYGTLLLASASSVQHVGRIYSVDRWGRTATIFTSAVVGRQDGIGIRQGELVWLVDIGPTSGRVYRYHLPIR